MKTRNGFTLIELLVVIAIIAILAAILFPVFAKAREKARQTACLSNEKQLGTSVMMYVQDFDEHLPSVWDTNTGLTWADEIYPYVKSLGVFVCPSNAVAGGTGKMYINGFGSSRPTDNSYVQIPASYSMNSDLGFLNGGQPNYGPYHPISVINTPAQKVMITEVNSQNPFTGWPDWWSCGGAACSAANANSSGQYNNMFAGHNGLMNVIYCDGHVHASKPVNLMTPLNQFGQEFPYTGQSFTTPSCTLNPTDTGAYDSINCDEVNQSALTIMAAVQQKYQ